MEVDRSIQEKAVEIFRQRIEEIVAPIDDLNFIYEINGLNIIVDVDECQVNICNAYNLNIHNPLHLEAIEIASWLFKELYHFRDFLFWVNDDQIDEDLFTLVCEATDTDLNEHLMDRVADIRRCYDHPLYPHLPPIVRERLHRVFYLFSMYVGKVYGWEEKTRLERMRSSPRHGFVYLVQSSTGSYKIGRTKDPNDRLRTFNVKLPFEVDYVCTIETADMYALERQLHQQFASKRISGEWFMLDAGDVASIQGMAVQA